jgi:hypothetical protein
MHRTHATLPRAAAHAWFTSLLLAALAVVAACGASPGARGATPIPSTPSTISGRLAALVDGAVAGLVQGATTIYHADVRSVQVDATVGRQADTGAAQQRAETICFRAQRALWTSGIALSEVNVVVLGPEQGDFGDVVTGAYGAADLKAATAAHLDWSALAPQTAWTHYDGVFLLTSLAPNQNYGVQPGATPTP